MRQSVKALCHAAWVALAIGQGACADQQAQQSQDQVVQGENYQEEYNNAENGQDAGNEYSEGQNYAQGQQESSNQYAQEAGGQDQDELQEIIDGMEGEDQGNAYAQGAQGQQQGYAVQQGTALQGGQQGYGQQQALTAQGGQQAYGQQQLVQQGQALPQGQVGQQFAAAPQAGMSGLPEMGSKMSYVVQRGDTLGSIATKIYGDIAKWREIADFTGMANPNRIYPGDVVYYQLTNQTMAFAAAYENAALAEVVVEQGDTLSTIASRVLGSSSDWKMIWRQNDTVSDPDVLSVGQTIYYLQPGAVASHNNDNHLEAWSHLEPEQIQTSQPEQTLELETLEQDTTNLNSAAYLNSVPNEFELAVAKALGQMSYNI